MSCIIQIIGIMIKLETDSLDVLTRTQPKLMVMFGTDWCGNCDILKKQSLKEFLIYTKKSHLYL